MIRRLTAALAAALLTAAVAACTPEGFGRVVPRAASDGLRPTDVPPPPTTSTGRPPLTPVEPEVHRGKGNATVTTNWPARLGFVTFDCPKCGGHVAVQTENELVVNDIGPYKGTQWINDTPDDQATTFTITATAAWTLTIADERSVPVLEPGKPLSGKLDTVVAVPEGGSTIAVKTKGNGNTAVWVLSGEYADLPVNQLGDYTGNVPVTGPAFVEIESQGTWTVTAS